MGFAKAWHASENLGKIGRAKAKHECLCSCEKARRSMGELEIPPGVLSFFIISMFMSLRRNWLLGVFRSCKMGCKCHTSSLRYTSEVPNIVQLQNEL